MQQKTVQPATYLVDKKLHVIVGGGELSESAINYLNEEIKKLIYNSLIFTLTILLQPIIFMPAWLGTLPYLFRVNGTDRLLSTGIG